LPFERARKSFETVNLAGSRFLEKTLHARYIVVNPTTIRPRRPQIEICRDKIDTLSGGFKGGGTLGAPAPGRISQAHINTLFKAS
jgi:hypothetical protein